ncbi:MAG: hypothetical protein AAGD07_18685 [Planctomycetota bacterium]
MPRSRVVFLVAMVVVSCVVHRIASHAQAPGAGNYQANANEVTEFKGTLSGVRGNVLMITREDGTEVQVQFPDRLESLRYVAKASPSAARSGALVRFQTTLGPTGAPLSPVEKLTFFAPVNPRQIKGLAAQQFIPGVHTANRQRPRPGQPVTGKVTVVGQLAMASPQGIMVRAGQSPVQARVSPNIQLEAVFNNLSLAQPGDAVTVAGFYNPPNDTLVKGDRVTITSERVYGEAAPKAERNPRGAKQVEEATTPAEEEPEEAKDAE